MPIQVLPEQTIAQIAAGEVVERPASVAKELLENALDAGATDIHIAVDGGGRRNIRVSDNGIGIASDEIELAFARHATSKLITIDDLMRIETLGFRGEALSSIAAVSQVSIMTRHRDEDVGTQMRVEGGAIVYRRAFGAPVGTIIDVTNLFYNTPARLKFLKKEVTEKRHIAQLVTRYAMAYPRVRFVLEQDEREIIHTGGSGQLADVMVKALGLENFQQMVEVILDEPAHGGRPAITVFGYTSMPSYHRADRTHITLFVNGRHVHDSRLTYAVVQAYHTLLMTGRFPVAVLMITLASEEVDVNVHPAKAEVRFRDSDQVFSAVQRAVREAVVSFSQVPGIGDGRLNGVTTAPPPMRWGNGMRAASQLDLDLPVEAPGQYAGHISSWEGGAADPTAVPEGPGAPLRPRTLPMLRVIGQIGATYIIAEGPSGMYLVDQHAAHERVLYEQFVERREKQEVVTQSTLAVKTVDFSPPEARLIEEYAHELKTVGFDLEPFGPNTFLIRAVPAILSDSDPREVLTGIVDDLAQGEKPGHSAVEEKIMMRVCRHAAVKAGQILSHEEMQSLMRQLERCRSPHTCPHGRPTILHLSNAQLAREFGRA